MNFEFLRTIDSDLAGLAGYAESYAQTDPASAAVKLRLFAERMVASIYHQNKLLPPAGDSLLDFLKGEDFTRIVQPPVLDKFHALRLVGNQGAHGKQISVTAALQVTRSAFDLACWWFLAFKGGEKASLPIYSAPPPGGAQADHKAQLKREKKEAIQALARQAEELKTLRHELEQREQDAAQHAAVITEVSASTNKARQALEFNELETRRFLIDVQLAEHGWDVAPNQQSNDQLGQEVKVSGQPTDSGTGYADYVLWDDNGKPLAVIEAKRTIKDSGEGQTQAKLYADALEIEHEQRPIIFYSNGHDIWIWDDAAGYPPRRLFGFYSKDSLQFAIYQRGARQALDTLTSDKNIAGRLYQVETIKRVTERFTGKQRKALIVQATGTGKTRVAIALCELLIRAGWAKRILFLCDRRELRKQAKNAFAEFTNEPLTIVGARTAQDRDKRVYLGTYPAMMRIFQSFDVGFFDLVIADESHRSIYNVYGDLFRYFDAYQIGLTATPVEFVNRNTFGLFNCDNEHPTANYPYERAVEENYLVPFEVHTYTTDFLRRGIKRPNLTEEQVQEAIDKGIDPETLAYEVRDLDTKVYNKDTSRHLLRNLMENGIRDASDQNVGKSIMFARNHEHAVLLQRTFDEMYPQYAGNFCRVIDNYDPRAEALIDEFKTPEAELTIAISVDMLDTGIDVPEVVNLVFAKPVYSKVKFWQMIGRGTRLCEGLFGPGEHKQSFRIFDHWGNFDFFEFDYKKIEPPQNKALAEILFETRIRLAEVALEAQDVDSFELAIKLIRQDIKALPERSISVKENWRVIQNASDIDRLRNWSAATVDSLRTTVAPLMRWRNLRGTVDAHKFDLLMGRAKVTRLQHSSDLENCKAQIIDQVSALQVNLVPVKERLPLIEQVKSDAFWQDIALANLEEARTGLRGIIHYRRKGGETPASAVVIDVAEATDQVETAVRKSNITSNEMKLYERRVEETLKQHFDDNPVLQKIRRMETVSPAELQTLTSLVLTQNADIDLSTLKLFYDDATSLDDILRGLIGLDAAAVKQHFEAFVHSHAGLSAKQVRFLTLLQNHIARFGAITVERLYEDPFTTVAANGVDDLFTETAADELIELIQPFHLESHRKTQPEAPSA